jgi:hypothetical protein
MGRSSEGEGGIGQVRGGEAEAQRWWDACMCVLEFGPSRHGAQPGRPTIVIGSRI